MQIGLEKNVRKLRRHLTCSVTQLSPLYSKAKLSLIRQEERRRQWHPTLVLLPGKSIDGGAWWAAVHGVNEESDTTERLHFYFSLLWIGEGNGNPLQYSCLENPRDGGAWWATVDGVAQSRTRLKRLSSSSRQEENPLTSSECALSFYRI